MHRRPSRVGIDAVLRASGREVVPNELGRNGCVVAIDAFPRRSYLVEGDVRKVAEMASKLREVTVDIPADALDAATRVTGKGTTPTIIEGLRELKRRQAIGIARTAREGALRS